jgi:hypothetical protein
MDNGRVFFLFGVSGLFFSGFGAFPWKEDEEKENGKKGPPGILYPRID